MSRCARSCLTRGGWSCPSAWPPSIWATDLRSSASGWEASLACALRGGQLSPLPRDRELDEAQLIDPFLFGHLGGRATGHLSRPRARVNSLDPAGRGPVR